MPEEIAKIRVIAKDTQIQSLKIKGLLPRPVVIKNLLLKDVTFHVVDREKV